MTNSLKITGLHFDICWKEKAQNFAKIEELTNNIETELLVLPEMFATGFCMEAEEIADGEDLVVNWMKDFAKNKNFAVAGSVSVSENEKYYNRFYLVEPQGRVHQYDKRHLFSFSGEDKIYSCGTERKIIEYKGVRILPQICYDLRFPVFSRNKNDYDLALYVANWPDSRIEAWQHLLKSRAIENQAYVFGVNRTGKDGNNLNYPQSSSGYFADGSFISTPINSGIELTLEMEKLREFREKFQFLQDGDNFTIDY